MYGAEELQSVKEKNSDHFSVTEKVYVHITTCINIVITLNRSWFKLHIALFLRTYINLLLNY